MKGWIILLVAVCTATDYCVLHDLDIPARVIPSEYYSIFRMTAEEHAADYTFERCYLQTLLYREVCSCRTAYIARNETGRQLHYVQYVNWTDCDQFIDWLRDNQPFEISTSWST